MPGKLLSFSTWWCQPPEKFQVLIDYDRLGFLFKWIGKRLESFKHYRSADNDIVCSVTKWIVLITAHPLSGASAEGYHNVPPAFTA